MFLKLPDSKGLWTSKRDYPASVSFVVRTEDIGKFTRLPKKLWKDPASFRPIDGDGYFEGWAIPAGTYVIEERSETSENNCKYAVDNRSNRVFFLRMSW